MRYLITLMKLASGITMACCKPGPADLVLKGGKVVTVDSSFAIHEAVAVHDGKIVFVGTNGEVEKYIYPNTTVLDCRDKCILPGFVDAHAGFQEEVLGSIEIGKYADFAVLDRDILEVKPADLLKSKAEFTIVGGTIRYRSE